MQVYATTITYCLTLQGSTIRKRQTYEEFLTKVSIFKGIGSLFYVCA